MAIKSRVKRECIFAIADREKRRIVSRVPVEESHCGIGRLAFSPEFLVWTKTWSGICHMGIAGTKPECEGNTSAATIDNRRVFATVNSSLVFFDFGGYESKKTLAELWNAGDKLLLRDGYIYGSEREWNMTRVHPARIWRVGSNGAPELLAIRKDRFDNDFDVYGGKLYWADSDAGGVFSLRMP